MSAPARSGYDVFRYTIEVGGIAQAHADTTAEACALAHRLRDTFNRNRPGQFVAVVDNAAGELVLGWWLLPAADLEAVTS